MTLRIRIHVKKGFRRVKRRRPLKKSKARFLYLFLLAVAAAALGAVIVILAQNARSRSAYRELAEIVLITPTPEPALPSPSAAIDAPTPSPALEAAEPTSDEPDIKVDWYKLNKMNHYVKAWLYCPGTEINYPVVQYKDNTYFLDHDFERHPDEAGTLFFDCGNVFSQGNENWIIYGHRRNDGSMFGSLRKFAQRDYYETHPVMYLLMKHQTYRVELFSCRTVHANKRYFALWFDTDEAYRQYLNKAVDQSYWKADTAPSPDDPILTLSTCSTYDGADEPRFLLHGRLIPLNESEPGESQNRFH